MDIQRLRLLLTDERGIALPMAMMVLLLLSVLIIAFIQLATSEPVIASNQLQVAQARAIAEAGLERAAWALDAGDATVTTPVDPNGIPSPLVGPAAAPYNGGTAFPVNLNATQLGVFTVKVTPGAVSNERNVEAFGWVPNNNNASNTHQRITATLVKIRFPDPPGALTVNGELDVSGNSLIDSRADTSCGNKAGTISLGATTIGSGAADIYGADGNNTKNQATDALQNQPQSVFDSLKYSNDELNILKSIAKSRGTYYQGSVLFNSGNKIPDGIIYIDTVSGNNIDADPLLPPTPTSDFASASIHGGSESGADGIFNGWLIVAGSLSISGDFHMQGLAYVLNDFTYTGTGTGLIQGAVISLNVRDTSSTSIDTNTGGNAAIVYNCAYARYGGGAVPPTWALKAGTYKEVTD